MQLNEDYASYLVSKDSLFVDDLLFACLQFLQTEPTDPTLTEMIQIGGYGPVGRQCEVGQKRIPFTGRGVPLARENGTQRPLLWHPSQ